jgi:hypothetical protein
MVIKQSILKINYLLSTAKGHKFFKGKIELLSNLSNYANLSKHANVTFEALQAKTVLLATQRPLQ